MLALFVLCPVAADEGAPSQIKVLKLIQSIGETPEDALQRFISEAVSVRLAPTGIKIVTMESSPDAIVYLPADFTKLAQQEQVDYILAGQFSSSENELSVEFNWYDVEENRISASVSTKGKIDLTLDWVIAQALDEIIDQVKEELTVPLPAESQELTARIETGNRESATEPKAGGTSASGAGGAVQVGSDDSARDLEAAGIRSAPVRKTMEIVTGFAPFITTGDSSEFFKIGYLTEMYLTFCLNLPVGQLGLGVQFGVNIFNTQGLVSSTENLLIPMGIDIRYVYGQGMPMGLFLHLDGGPAIMIVD